MVWRVFGEDSGMGLVRYVSKVVESGIRLACRLTPTRLCALQLWNLVIVTLSYPTTSYVTTNFS
jgi:hypothetical protein